jgi:catechol 2,3-dioxygenase-like lactoylglutathione lyase family enzyme
MEQRISIITLGVTNFARSLRFYRDGLGWPTRATEASDIAFFNTTGTRFAIYPLEKLVEDISPAWPATRSGFSGITLAHNVRTREEVAVVLAQAEAAGATILKPAQDAFWGGHSGYFSDPDGYCWEIAFAPGFQFAADGSLIVEGPTVTPENVHFEDIK